MATTEDRRVTVYFGTTTSSGHGEDVQLLKDINRWISILFPSVLFMIGLPGNLLTIAVLRRPLLRENFISVFLIWMCIGNTCSLVSGLARMWIRNIFNFDYGLVSYFWCMFSSTIQCISVSFSNWLIVAVTATRLYFTHCPQRTKKINFSPNVAWGVVMFVVIGTVIPSISFTAFGVIVTHKDGKDSENFYGLDICVWDLNRVTTYFRFIWWGLGPTGLVILFNLLIVWSHFRNIKRDDYYPWRSKASKRNLLCLVFFSDFQMITMIVPMVIYSALVPQSFYGEVDRLLEARYQLGYTIVTSTLYLNFATNWIVYCGFGNRYRKELYNLLTGYLRLCFPEAVVRRSSGYLQEQAEIREAGEQLHRRSTNPKIEPRISFELAVESQERSQPVEKQLAGSMAMMSKPLTGLFSSPAEKAAIVPDTLESAV